MEEMLSKKNQRLALEHLEQKKDTCGIDGMHMAEFKEFWYMNYKRIEDELKQGTYTPGIVKNYEIINGSGKRRTVSNYNFVDRFITRLLAQKLKRYIEPLFYENSCAYQDNKGILTAVMKVKEYVEAGNTILVEIDIRNYFDMISLEKMLSLIKEYITEESLVGLIGKYLYCKVDNDEYITEKKVGLIQGNSISPILSNLYLHSLDKYMQEQGCNWMRFADNIYVLAKDNDEAVTIYNNLCEILKSEYELDINEKKSGIHDIFNCIILGYTFYRKKGQIDIRRRQYITANTFQNWHRCKVEKINREYHLIGDGILNKKDYALLFENEEEKHHIPVEIVDNLNLYSEVTISSSVLRTLGNNRIALSVFDKYGNLLGHYMPESLGSYSAYLLKQVEVYIDESRRLSLAKSMEIAGLHNMRANLRYYQKKKRNLQESIAYLSESIKKINEEKTVDGLLLIEARARQKYYAAFNGIIQSDFFRFDTRSKRPPKDAINALISFGNTLLYNQFLQIIWKTALDPRIGVVHATNRRAHSLNLDFADIYKPIISDRVIFSVLNCQQLHAKEHFEGNAEEGVFLNKMGKRIFLEEFNKKLDSKIVVNEKSISYRQLMIDEVRHFQKGIIGEEKYKPYKYY